MAVFYIRERNAFYSWLTLNHITPTAQALWNALFTIYNAQGWPDEWLEVPESLLCSYMHVGKQALYDARNQLKNKGILDFQKGNRNKQAVKYRMIWLTPLDDNGNDGEMPYIPASYPPSYPQSAQTKKENEDIGGGWCENQTNNQPKDNTKQNTNEQTKDNTKCATITPPLNNNIREEREKIKNKTLAPEGAVDPIPAVAMSLTHARAGAGEQRQSRHPVWRQQPDLSKLPPLPINYSNYLLWWDEMDIEKRWKQGFEAFLRANYDHYTRQMLSCALTITQNKFDRGKVTNPLEYFKQTLIDWDKRELYTRKEIEYYLGCEPTTGSYYASLAWEAEHNRQYG